MMVRKLRFPPKEKAQPFGCHWEQLKRDFVIWSVVDLKVEDRA